MTRRHFVLIADVLKSQEPPHFSDDYALWESIVDKFARELRGTNPNFDSSKFRKACYNDG